MHYPLTMLTYLSIKGNLYYHNTSIINEMLEKNIKT